MSKYTGEFGEFVELDPAEILANGETQIRKSDNPVPSLDSKDIKLIIEALCAYGDDEEITDLCDKLENGVETNKEQPKIIDDRNDSDWKEN